MRAAYQISMVVALSDLSIRPRRAMSVVGSKPEKLDASICFPLCPLRADIAQCSRHVRFVPIADMTWTASLVEGWRHLQSIALGLVMVDPELRFLLRHHIGNALHRSYRAFLVGVD